MKCETQRFCARPNRALLLALIAWTGLTVGGGPAAAQAPDAGGVARVAELLRGLDGVKRVLMIGAHPDDEDTALLAALARGEGVDAAYLSLTRGEGGQNLIGSELFEGLGVVRTEELVAARRLDGAKQFFTRAFDFGYSKGADEALSLWPREELLHDVTWIVRTYRPQVIVSVFSGTPSDGHGQHQAAGIMAQEVFEAAADPNRFPEQLTGGIETWEVSKLYQRAWLDPSGTTFALETGRLDPVSGRSYLQVAMASRSQHRSQDMGAAQPLGPSQSGLRFVRAVDGIDPDGALFAHVDTSLVGLVRSDAEAVEYVEAYRRDIAKAQGFLSLTDPGAALAPLLSAKSNLSATLNLRVLPARVQEELTQHGERLDQAILASAGVAVDVRSSRDRLVPGETFRIDVEIWNGGSSQVRSVRPAVDLPSGARARPVTPPIPRRRFGPPTDGSAQGPSPLGDWSAEAVGESRPLGPGEFAKWSFEVELPDDLPYSVLYHQERPREGAMYQWPQSREHWGLPRNPPRFPASVAVDLGGPVTHWRGGVEYRGVDPARGEFREPLLVLPAVSVALDPGTLVWPTDRRASRTVTVQLESHAPDAQAGVLRLEVPTGWTAEPAEQRYRLERAGARAGFSFELQPPETLAEGEVTICALATTEGRTWDEAAVLIDYEHTRRTALFSKAEALVVAFPVRVAEGLRVGYVMGSGDSGPAALREIGVEPALLTPADLASGDLSHLDVIVLGVRAYETRQDLIQYNETVLDFVRAGGTLVSQYNQYGYAQSGVAPYPVTIRRPHDRVTDETADVRLLQPDHPLLAGPNRIGSEDFDGWVQERGLYFLGEWDPAFQPLLEMADPGEEPKLGSLLVAPLGDGQYVYTGLALFRQFPNGVPGAYRLLANLISLGRRTAS